MVPQYKRILGPITLLIFLLPASTASQCIPSLPSIENCLTICHQLNENYNALESFSRCDVATVLSTATSYCYLCAQHYPDSESLQSSFVRLETSLSGCSVPTPVVCADNPQKEPHSHSLPHLKVHTSCGGVYGSSTTCWCDCFNAAAGIAEMGLDEVLADGNPFQCSFANCFYCQKIPELLNGVEFNFEYKTSHQNVKKPSLLISAPDS